MNQDINEAGDEVLRAFIALEISDEVRAALDRLQRDLMRGEARVGWVTPARIHLTLAFLGDIFAAQLPGLADALDAVAEGCPPFAFDVAGTGAFGPPKSPRVVWAGVEEPTGALVRLQAAAAVAVTGLGFRIEERAFHPHLTLGRVRDRRGAADLTSRLESFRTLRCGRVEVRRVLLLQSVLSSQGAEYRVRHSSELKGA
ncbi:MAG TPA: RNA 2',3'-cyclic phosphodiesterase [Kiritimatiellia bacterium]|nr:RNA 2',3'-cyclic phosphodiesterase [Kiritimatiellia bacterium]HRZ11251.1 RNA 2',3'-cyclic phosphodiesterase [Kiritimatiellia bacterium]HSA19102.1 RNA 2',3'-cyclic phosphodiesterase [Kiritimatiellia bacterium]